MNYIKWCYYILFIYDNVVIYFIVFYLILQEYCHIKYFVTLLLKCHNCFPINRFVNNFVIFCVLTFLRSEGKNIWEHISAVMFPSLPLHIHITTSSYPHHYLFISTSLPLHICITTSWYPHHYQFFLLKSITTHYLFT